MKASESKLRTSGILLSAVALCVCAAATTAQASLVLLEPLQSPRLERAKDLIAEEQWERAIEQLKAAAEDAKERNRDEALFWLAHSQHQARDLAGAVATIARLERQHPTSRWVKPARSLRIEIAQKLRRDDVLWYTAAPPPPPPAPAATPRPAPAPPKVVTPARPSAPEPPSAPAANTVPKTPVVVAPPMPVPSPLWIPEGWNPDMSLRIQALGSLMQTDAPKVIPVLKEIALEAHDTNEARRALFVLAQSGRPEAQTTILEVAKQASEPVQIAAVRELGRFGGEQAAEALLQVYTTGNPRVKYQVVTSLAERSATNALLRIAEMEKDLKLQESVIIRLGQAGAREHLERFYPRARIELKKPIIEGLFNVPAEDALIRIARQERDAAIRSEVITRLRLLGTPKARAFIEAQEKGKR
jgi:hypothetical protein